MNGLRSLSRDQSLFLKRGALSILKRESKDTVACKLMGESLLCSNKNFCFGVIAIHPTLNGINVKCLPYLDFFLFNLNILPIRIFVFPPKYYYHLSAKSQISLKSQYEHCQPGVGEKSLFLIASTSCSIFSLRSALSFSEPKNDCFLFSSR